MVHVSLSGASFHCYIPFSYCVAVTVGRECLSLFRCTFSQMDVNPCYTCFLQALTAFEHVFYRRYSLCSAVSSTSEDPQKFEVLYVDKTVRNAAHRMVNSTPGITIKGICLPSLLFPISSLEKSVHCNPNSFAIMFNSRSLLIFVLSGLALSSGANPIVIRDNLIRLPLAKTLNVTSAGQILKADQARAARIVSSLKPQADGAPSAPAVNAASFYSSQLNVGSPSTACK